MKSRWLCYGLLTAYVLIARPAAGADDTLDEIVVTATLRSTSAAELPQSVTVLDRDTLQGAGVQHFEDVLGLIPDLNWAAGTSRPRFFQLRGIGEVEQYQGAPNPSVGFLIDDIDFSGVGMPATLFDTQQIEVLRGPQGTTYGANALAGLISVRTVDPGTDFELNSEITGADYDTRAAGLAVGDGFAGGSAGWRLVAQQYLSDGFRHNAYLDENSTNGYDEGTLRGKLRWQITDALRADLTLMHVNINNGYDAWSIYNTYTTYSNEPGRDAQLSNGAALRLSDSIAGVGELRSVTSTANSKIIYSFDGDWGNDAFWAATTGYAPYDYFQSDNRNRRTLAEDLRLIGDPSHALFGRVRWLAGVYALRLTESDHQAFTWDAYDAAPDGGPGAGSSGLDSHYSATNVALYGSLEADVGARNVLSGGLRVEQREAHYGDSADVQTPFPHETNHMVGGNLSWDKRRGRGRASIRHAGARLQGRRLQHRLGDPVRAAQIRSRVALEPRDRPQICAGRQPAAAASRCVLHAAPKHAGVSVRAAAAEQSAELCVLHAERQQRRELRPGGRGRLPPEQPLADFRQRLAAAHALSRCDRCVRRSRHRRPRAALRARLQAVGGSGIPPSRRLVRAAGCLGDRQLLLLHQRCAGLERL